MKLEVNITKTKLFIILGAIFLVAGLFFGYAYNSPTYNPTAPAVPPAYKDKNAAPVFGHSADEMNVRLTDGSVVTLQDAINQEKFGAGTISINLGSVVEFVGKNIVESPWGGVTPTAAQVALSSCPAGYVLVGFNIYNAGSTHGLTGSLYCRQILLTINGVSSTQTSSSVTLSNEQVTPALATDTDSSLAAERVANCGLGGRIQCP